MGPGGSLNSQDLFLSPSLFAGHRGNRILHEAARGAQLDLLKSLLEKGCNPNLLNEYSETPLHLAAKNFTKSEKIRFTYNMSPLLLYMYVYMLSSFEKA